MDKHFWLNLSTLQKPSQLYRSPLNAHKRAAETLTDSHHLNVTSCSYHVHTMANKRCLNIQVTKPPTGKTSPSPTRQQTPRYYNPHTHTQYHPFCIQPITHRTNTTTIGTPLVVLHKNTYGKKLPAERTAAAAAAAAAEHPPDRTNRLPPNTGPH